MTAFHFRKAVSSEAKPLVGLYSESGAGKTKSALLLAKGFTGDMSKVVMVETESGRGEAYADDEDVGGYNVISLREEFSPKTYGGAIATAEKEGAQALIIDSASHEWEGVQGVLAMAAENQAAGKKGVLVWQQPKMQHAREFMLRLTQTPIPLVIVCMRAKYPMYEVKPADVERWERAGKPGGKPPKVGEWARSWNLEPKQSDDILFEMFVHGWIDREHRLHVTKYTLDETMRKVFIDGEPITIDTGKRLADWAAGRKTAEPEDAVLTKLRAEAAKGTAALRAAWSSLDEAGKDRLRSRLDALKVTAGAADARAAIAPKTNGSAAPSVTADSVIAMMDKRTDVDLLDADATLIDSIADLLERERARNRYHELREKLGQP